MKPLGEACATQSILQCFKMDPKNFDDFGGVDHAEYCFQLAVKGNEIRGKNTDEEGSLATVRLDLKKALLGVVGYGNTILFWLYHFKYALIFK
ncbi:hypothetical protein Hdeb2414_s0021g00575011 [Helianthus debilis subsp. tardiflorus]